MIAAIDDPSCLLTPKLLPTGENGVTSEDALLRPTTATLESKDAWQAVDEKLIEWRRDPAQLEEDDLIPPSYAALHRAMEIAREMMKCGRQPPKRVVPDGNGGIDFERWSGPVIESIEIDRTGRAEIVVLRDRRVVERREFFLRL